MDKKLIQRFFIVCFVFAIVALIIKIILFIQVGEFILSKLKNFNL